MPFFAIIIGVIAGFIMYGSTMTSYRKAGAGQTYRIESSTNVRFTRQIDNRGLSRSHVDHGFYSGSVSAAGRSEAYPMPQSIKNSIENAKDQIKDASDSAGSAARPQNQSRPPRPNGGMPNRPPRPNGGPANRPPHRPGAPGTPGGMNRRDK